MAQKAGYSCTEPMICSLEKFQLERTSPSTTSTLSPHWLHWDGQQWNSKSSVRSWGSSGASSTKENIYVDVFNSLQGKQVKSLKQPCKFLEKVYGTHFTDTLLTQNRDEIEWPLTIKVNRLWLYLEASVFPRKNLLTRDNNWLKLWPGWC